MSMLIPILLSLSPAHSLPCLTEKFEHHASSISIFFLSKDLGARNSGPETITESAFSSELSALKFQLLFNFCCVYDYQPVGSI